MPVILGKSFISEVGVSLSLGKVGAIDEPLGVLDAEVAEHMDRIQLEVTVHLPAFPGN